MINKKIIIVVGVIVFIGLCVLIITQLRNSQVFRLNSTTPNINNDIPSSTQRLTLNFSKDVDPKSVSIQNLSGDTIVKAITIDKKTVNLILQNLDIDRDYTLLMKNIKSTNGQEISEVSLSFRTRFVPYNQLSDKEKAQQVADTDPELNPDSIQSFLPDTTRTYNMVYAEAINTSTGEKKPVVLVKDLFYFGIDPPYPSSELQITAQTIKQFLENTGVDRKSYLLTAQDPRLANFLGADPIPPGFVVREYDFTGDGNPPD